MPELGRTYISAMPTPRQVDLAARAMAERAGADWRFLTPNARTMTRVDAKIALEAVLPEILSEHTGLLLSRLAKAKQVHDNWAGVHHDSDTHQLLAELHQALFGGEPS